MAAELYMGECEIWQSICENPAEFAEKPDASLSGAVFCGILWVFDTVSGKCCQEEFLCG